MLDGYGLAGSGVGVELVGLLSVMAPGLANWLGATTVVWLSTSCVMVAVLTAKEVVPLYRASMVRSASVEKVVVQVAWPLRVERDRSAAADGGAVRGEVDRPARNG